MEKKTEWEYAEIIRWRKKEMQLNGWNAFDVNAGDLNEEVEPGIENTDACIEGMLQNMLEGDTFLSGNEYDRNKQLTIRYYCDNLSSDRRKIFG